MASTILYPPVIESKMPTFVIDPARNITSTRVYFSISDYNSLNNFARIPATQGIVVAKTTSYNIPVQEDMTTSTVYEEKVVNPYDTYSTREEKLYHLWLDKHEEQGWRRFYCAMPLSVYKEHPKAFEMQLTGACLGPMLSNPSMTYTDLHITAQWELTTDMVLIVTHVPTDTQAVYLPPEYYEDDPSKFSYLWDYPIERGYVYPDIAQMEKYYESLNSLVPTTTETTQAVAKEVQFKIDPQAYPAIDGYVYPWIMVTCKDQSGINKFKPIQFENDSSLDSGIHFYTMQRDEELYQAGETNCYFIEIPANDVLSIKENDTENTFSIDEYYKIQIRFLDKNIDYINDFPYESTYWMDNHIYNFSEWSSVCLLKRIAQPIVTLKNSILSLNPYGTQINFAGLRIHKHFLTINGTVTFEQATNTAIEYLDSMRFVLYDKNDVTTILEDSGWIKSQSNGLNGENDFSYTFKKLYEKKQQYILYIYYQTNNGFIDNYISFSTTVNSSAFADNFALTVLYPYATIDMAIDNVLNTNIELDTIPNHESGEILVRIWNTDSNFNGTVIVRRTSSLSNFEEWDNIMTFNNVNAVNTIYWIDRSAIAGEWYRYAIIYSNEFSYVYEDIYGNQQTALKSVETDMIYNKEPVTLFLDDSFLIGDYKQLKIKFDPTISSFKRKITESSIETLGSKYPFFNRNAVIDYKTFPFSGTIATWMDDEENFAQKREIFTAKALPLHMNFITENNFEAHYDWILEKKFRDKVTDFLMSNKPKLFKSLTEGNILVKVHDVSFTPNQTLSRMIWSFSGTLTEVGEATTKNLVKYNIQDDTANLTFNITTATYDPLFDNDEDLEVLPNGFYIMQDEDIKKYTAALIGEEDMRKYHIRLTSSSAHSQALNKLINQIDTWGPLKEDN